MAENGDKSVSADGLAQAASKAAKGGLPPVHLWNPPYCGEMDLLIRADGLWIHEGTPIGREAMVRLFSTILKREGDRFFLVTPVEKVGIRVEDAPFLAVDAQIEADRITFTTNVGDTVMAGPGHDIVIRGDASDPRPYVHVRAGLEALIDRKTFYRLADAAAEGPDGRTGVRSGGQFFALEP
ncbi:DUF1285 domain-containing protein [Paracoccus sp. (in: a-proteobacteria)]|uniref:DUF1285 domain-containing protein n=1 Tax=Paracoccus sp. TaxID=267 RepID=UPI00396C811B